MPKTCGASPRSSAAKTIGMRLLTLVSPNSGEPPPPLPDEVVEKTRAKYVEAYERLTGREFT